MLNVRNATTADFDRIMEIYGFAQDYLIKNGNPTQWGHFYPTADLVGQDIDGRVCKAVCENNDIHGVFVLFNGAEPTYSSIKNGAWLNDEPYATILRIASDGQTHGVFKCAVEYCKNKFSNIRIATHADNKIMQSLIQKNGFTKCGTIILEDGTPRIAYQWCEKNFLI